MMTIDPSKDLTAIGRLAGRAGVHVDHLLALVEELGIVPAMRVDRVVFLDRDQAERIVDAVRRRAHPQGFEARQ